VRRSALRVPPGPGSGGPFASLLNQLFQQEQRQYEELLRSQREAVAMPSSRANDEVRPAGAQPCMRHASGIRPGLGGLAVPLL
jgi:hypothetical protein